MTETLWPLADLQVVTPRLTLRYVSDDLGEELAALASRGDVNSATTPFAETCTDAPCVERERNTLRSFWRNRADTTVEHWDLNLAAVVGGVAVGMCSIESDAFPIRRIVAARWWLVCDHHGRGVVTEMRDAALHLIFAGFDADLAITRACYDNTAVEFPMTPAQWATLRRNDIHTVGVEAVRKQLMTARLYRPV